MQIVYRAANIIDANLVKNALEAEGIPAFVGGQQFFRVRLGPIDSVDKADRLLDRVIRAGHSDARLVVQ